jgi:hypothetical protein
MRKGKKIFTRTQSVPPLASPSIDSPSTNRLKEAEQLIFQDLKQLQKIYNAASKTNANKIPIERATFEKITTLFQRAYAHARSRKREYPQCSSANQSQHCKS